MLGQVLGGWGLECGLFTRGGQWALQTAAEHRYTQKRNGLGNRNCPACSQNTFVILIWSNLPLGSFEAPVDQVQHACAGSGLLQRADPIVGHAAVNELRPAKNTRLGFVLVCDVFDSTINEFVHNSCLQLAFDMCVVLDD